MTTAEIQALDRQFVWHPFTHMKLWLADDPLVITHGEGAYVFDSDGRKYFDGTASLWCNVHGHRVPKIDAAIRDQLAKIGHTTLLGLTNEPAAKLAERLVQIAPSGLKKVFFSDSGATATEAAFKMAAQYWWNLGRPEKCEFVGLTEAYHGDTVGAMSVGRTTAFHKPYWPMLFKTHFAPAPIEYRAGLHARVCDDALLGLRAILEKHANTIAAICIEPKVMGAAGMIVQPEGYLAGVRALADEFNVLLIADEVATGFGRTGAMFACDLEEVAPDLLCLGKGITGGYLPLAATLTTQKIFDAFLGEPWEGKTFFHGHTYTGNPLACVAALASLDLFAENDLLNHVRETASAFSLDLATLKDCPVVGDIRQCRFMVGVELVADPETARPFDPRLRVGAAVCQRLRARGILVRPLGDTIVINPPLITTAEEWRMVISALRIELDKITPDAGVAERGDEQIAGDY
ncbi:MAG: adenosylmethionine-8-amino-7-oxononanoate aminotransferase apoenzyme [Phycisphaerales bacterium]|nr:adenosylmethionine-8-amino-7-oxononanoate aminotransferase apoenzyme [Phycisphaerales bacterium]